jgi:hypothetical protein
MKKLLLLAALGISSLMAAPAKAQVSLSVNIGVQPKWGPTGYNHVDYYYLPDVDCYYDVPTRQYIYLSGNVWVHRRSLPSRYRGYDLYRGRKVVINSPNPWMHHNVYHTRYVTNYHRGAYHGRPGYVHSRSTKVIVRNHNTYRGGHGNSHSHGNHGYSRGRHH